MKKILSTLTLLVMVIAFPVIAFASGTGDYVEKLNKLATPHIGYNSIEELEQKRISGENLSLFTFSKQQCVTYAIVRAREKLFGYNAPIIPGSTGTAASGTAQVYRNQGWTGESPHLVSDDKHPAYYVAAYVNDGGEHIVSNSLVCFNSSSNHTNDAQYGHIVFVEEVTWIDGVEYVYYTDGGYSKNSWVPKRETFEQFYNSGAGYCGVITFTPVCDHSSCEYTLTGYCAESRSYAPTQHTVCQRGIYRVKSDTTAYFRPHPYKVADATETLSAGMSDIHVMGAVINSLGNCWYKVKYNGADGYIHSTSLEWVSIDPDYPIEDGTYMIVPLYGSDYRLDVHNAQTANGTNIKIYKANGNTAQNFVVTSLGDGSYRIISQIAGKSVDVDNAGTTAGTNVQIYANNNTNAQKWVIKDAGDGYFYIIPKVNPDLYLTVGDCIGTTGARNIIISIPGEDVYQKWMFVPINQTTTPNGTYTLAPQCAPDSRLDVKGGKVANETNIQIYKANDTKAQNFIFTDLGDGCYRIESEIAGKSLDVAGGKRFSGTNVQIYKNNSTDAQKWMLQDAGDGYYYIVPLLNTNLCLDVADGQSKNGTNVRVLTKNNSSSQKWMLNVAHGGSGHSF